MSWPLEGERTVWVRGQLLWILLCVLELTGHSSLTDGTSVGSSGEKKSACVVSGNRLITVVPLKLVVPKLAS